MILGYEQPVDIPVMSIYDKQAIRDYVGAVKEQYQQARQDLDTFYNKYGDFYSIIPGDTERYYDKGVGKVMAVYDDLMRRGIDPLKSPEGRGALEAAQRRALQDRELAVIKGNSKVAPVYIENILKGRAAGTYDDRLEGKKLHSLGWDPEHKMTDAELGANPLSGLPEGMLLTRTAPETKLDVTKYYLDKFKNIPTKTEERTGAGGIKEQREYRPKEALLVAVEESFDMNNPSMAIEVEDRLAKMQQTNPNATLKDAEKAVKEDLVKLGMLDKPWDINDASKVAYQERQQNYRSRLTAGGGGRRDDNISIFDNAYAHYNKDAGYGVATYNPVDRMKEGIGLKTGINGNPSFDGKNAGWVIDRRYATQLFIRNHEKGGISRIKRAWGNNPNAKGRSGDMYQLKSLGRVECVIVDGYPQYFDVCEPKNFEAPGHEVLVPIEKQVYSGTVK